MVTTLSNLCPTFNVLFKTQSVIDKHHFKPKHYFLRSKKPLEQNQERSLLLKVSYATTKSLSDAVITDCFSTTAF